MSSISDRVTNLSPKEKRALLKKVLQEKTEDRSDVLSRPLQPALEQRYEPFPLSDIQYAYWIGRSGAFELGDVSIHVYMEVASVGRDLGRLERAWQRVVERHEMLRAIVRPDGQQQILAEVPAYQIEVTDLRGQTPA